MQNLYIYLQKSLSAFITMNAIGIFSHRVLAQTFRDVLGKLF